MDIGSPSQRRSYLRPTIRYASAKVKAPLMEYSYILLHGTRLAETPRATTPRSRTAVASTKTIVAIRLDFAVLVRSIALDAPSLLARTAKAVS